MSTGGTTNYAMNLTASGSFLRAHGNGDGSAVSMRLSRPPRVMAGAGRLDAYRASSYCRGLV